MTLGSLGATWPTDSCPGRLRILTRHVSYTIADDMGLRRLTMVLCIMNLRERSRPRVGCPLTGDAARPRSGCTGAERV